MEAREPTSIVLDPVALGHERAGLLYALADLLQAGTAEIFPGSTPRFSVARLAYPLVVLELAASSPVVLETRTQRLVRLIGLAEGTHAIHAVIQDRVLVIPLQRMLRTTAAPRAWEGLDLGMPVARRWTDRPRIKRIITAVIRGDETPPAVAGRLLSA